MSRSQMTHRVTNLCQGIDLLHDRLHFPVFDHLPQNIQIGTIELGDEEHDLLTCSDG